MASPTEFQQMTGLTDDEAARLAMEEPSALAAILSGPLIDSVDLSCAAEIFGRDCTDSGIVVPVLMAILEHERALVREGAVYGLHSHRHVARVVDVLRRVAEADPSAGVRLAAQEALTAP